MKKIIFSHSGNIGDILYSLNFVTEFLQKEDFDLTKDFIGFNIKINAPACYSQPHPNGNVIMTKKSAEFLKPLLDEIGIFTEVTISESVPENSFDLDIFRKLPINLGGGDIRGWYYNLYTKHLAQDFSLKTVTLNNKSKTDLHDKVLLIYTERYQNPYIDYKFLEKYVDKILFIGLPEEHKKFEEKYFKVEQIKINNALEVAYAMKSSKGVIGNASGLYSIAECMKVPRIFCSCEFMMLPDGRICLGAMNVNPVGGYFERVQTQFKFENSVKEFIWQK